MSDNEFLTIDGKEVRIEGERNLLEVIRKAGIDIPTFCYHSHLSVYGACRLCLVEVEGRGIVGSCSTPPEPGMKVKTTTQEIREIRKIAVELLLANHEKTCPTCSKSATCQLQEIARRLGVDEVRFKSTHEPVPVDRSSPSLVRDPNKCILCGDCVRVCHEIQGIGAIDFAHRGSSTAVLPAFGKDLKHVECVYCGQCASVCPTGALTVKSEIDAVWEALSDPKKKVVAQIAPAVRVAIGEHFGLAPGTVSMGQTVAALKAMGFDQVYDTSFAADLTVIEEANEFLARKEKGERLPIFTSCCPAWVKFAEQYYPSLLPHLSSCRSPQQMFGSIAREVLPEKLGVDNKDLVIVSIMPCTAKKFEAKQEKFIQDGIADVDHVLTTQELGRMIEAQGLRFSRLEPESLDMPFGFKTGAGVIFGTSGGVTEAVLRYAVEKVSGTRLEGVDFRAVRG
ncbi:MAG TPA: 4Fe-4S binding protein, partial [Armatimonadetes bacterium]|nr:4Fe-4S binding protein [Armatimonadota bacterium]